MVIPLSFSSGAASIESYATAAGSTAGVAEAVGEALRSEGATVDVRRARTVTGLSGYDAVVLGTGVRAGRTYAEAAKFLGAYQGDLAQIFSDLGQLGIDFVDSVQGVHLAQLVDQVGQHAARCLMQKHVDIDDRNL